MTTHPRDPAGPARHALRTTVRALADGDVKASSRRGVPESTRGLGWVLRERRGIPAGVGPAIDLVAAFVASAATVGPLLRAGAGDDGRTARLRSHAG